MTLKYYDCADLQQTIHSSSVSRDSRVYRIFR